MIKEALKEIWKENEGGFMVSSGECGCRLGAVQNKARADLIYRKSLLQETEGPEPS